MTEDKNPTSLWELLWNFDPNGLIAVDTELNIRIVNPAFCRMFRMEKDQILGTYVGDILDKSNADEFREVWNDNKVLRSEQEFPDLGLFLSKVMFAIRAEGIIACIMVDQTHEWRQRIEISKLQKDTIEKVTEVVDNQMKVAQEIAGLLGETTAQTKVSLLKLIEMVQQENV